MNKRYMDFVPSAAKGGGTAGTGSASKKAKPEVVMPKRVERPRKAMPEAVLRSRKAMPEVSAKKTAVSRVETPKRVEMPKRVETPKAAPARKAVETEPKLGVIEDLKTGAIETQVSRSHFNADKDNIRAVKFQRVGLKESATKPFLKASGLSTKRKPNESVYKTPSSPFINQDKVLKRPLSKNVYPKKIEVPKEEPKGPVTIIAKPEKQAHVSLIVAIILTIILGAAAGTVAFLLLPK